VCVFMSHKLTCSCAFVHVLNVDKIERMQDWLLQVMVTTQRQSALKLPFSIGVRSAFVFCLKTLVFKGSFANYDDFKT
jgi:hypothetical protein